MSVPSLKTGSTIVAVLLSLAAFTISAWISVHIFERLPHIEDEMAYVWQADVISRGHLTTPTPPCRVCFLEPFVVDYNGIRFGKYPIAWPVVLSFGVRLGIRHLVNPLLAALAIWLTFRLGQKISGDGTGLLAAFLMLTSPMFLMNSSNLLSHAWGLVLALTFVLGWLDATADYPPVPRPIAVLVSGLSLGLLALTRPLSAVAIAVPFAIHGLVLLIRGLSIKKQSVLGIGGIALLLGGFHFVWQAALTGNPFINPYTLWWPYDQIGFGPGIGLQEGGYSLLAARVNLDFSLEIGSTDLFGWPHLSYIFLPFGLWALRRNLPSWPVIAVAPAIVLAYCLYWISSWLFGPRYFYEGLFSAVIVSSAGITWLAGLWPEKKAHWNLKNPWRRAQSLIVMVIVTFLVCASTVYYLPTRIGNLSGLYGVQRAYLQPFLQPQAMNYAPAIIGVHRIKTWYEYGSLLELASPYLDSPFIFVIDPTPEEEATLRSAFPERAFFHYYVDEPGKFYTAPRPELEYDHPSVK